MRLCYLDCVGGLAGDMLLAALLDAGAELGSLRAVPAALGLEAVEITAERVERQGIGALHVRVAAPGDGDHRDYREIRRLVEEARVAAIPASAFYHQPGPGDGLVRFAFCKDEATLHEAIERMGQAI